MSKKKEKDLYWIWRHRNDEQFLDYIQDLIDQQEYEQALRKIKISEVLLTYSFFECDLDQKKKVKEKIKILSNYIPDLVNQFNKQLKVLSKLQKKVMKKMETINKKVSKKNYGFSYLEYLNWLLYKESRSEFGGSLHEKSDIVETIVSSSNHIIKYMLKNNISFDMNFILDKHSKKEIENLFYSGNKVNVINDIIESWVFGDIAITKGVFKTNLTIKEIGPFFKEFLLCKIPFLDLKMKKNMVQIQDLSSRNSNNIKDYIYSSYEFFCKSVTEYFFTSDLSIIYNGLSLQKWILSYLIILEQCVTATNVHKYYCRPIFYTKKEITEIYLKNGFSNDEIRIVLDFLTFNENYRDLFDTPLVAKNGGYFLMPFLITKIDFSRSLVSRLNVKEEKINKKGTSFEKHIEVLADIAEIKHCTNIKIKHRKRDYEIDIVLVLDDDIYILEAKTQRQPVSIMEYESHKEQLQVYLKKFERNANFFCNEGIGYIYKKLNIKKHRNIYKVFITNVPQVKTKIDDIYLLDEICYYRFMKRQPSTIEVYNENRLEILLLLLHKSYYNGKVNSKNLLEFLNDDKDKKIDSKKIQYRDVVLKEMGITWQYFNIEDLKLEHLKDYI